MKKYMIAVSVLFLIPLVSKADFQVNLKYGQSGPDVYQLQDVLQEQGDLAHASTGYFGLLTLNAVKVFQTSNGIPNTGYVGVLTRTALNAILASAVDTSNQAEQTETGKITPAPEWSPTPQLPPSGYVQPTPTQNTPTEAPSASQPTIVEKPVPVLPTITYKNEKGVTSHFELIGDNQDFKGFNFIFTSNDFTQEELNTITYKVEKVRDGWYEFYPTKLPDKFSPDKELSIQVEVSSEGYISQVPVLSYKLGGPNRGPTVWTGPF